MWLWYTVYTFLICSLNLIVTYQGFNLSLTISNLIKTSNLNRLLSTFYCEKITIIPLCGAYCLCDKHTELGPRGQCTGLTLHAVQETTWMCQSVCQRKCSWDEAGGLHQEKSGEIQASSFVLSRAVISKLSNTLKWLSAVSAVVTQHICINMRKVFYETHILCLWVSWKKCCRVTVCQEKSMGLWEMLSSPIERVETSE